MLFVKVGGTVYVYLAKYVKRMTCKSWGKLLRVILERRVCAGRGDYKSWVLPPMGSPKVGKVNVWGQVSRAKFSQRSESRKQSMIACFPQLSWRKKSNVHFGRTEKVDAKAFISMARGTETVLHPESLRIPQ
jgi:hypothetical protein